MYSYFEDIFKRAFLKSIVHTHREISADLSKFDDKDITREYRKILDKVAIGMINETFENEKKLNTYPDSYLSCSMRRCHTSISVWAQHDRP